MKVTGYMIREALKRLDLKLKALDSQFDESRFFFEGEEKTPITTVAENIARTENMIGVLQEIRARYNLGVTVRPGGVSMTLLTAIKVVGGLGRLEKKWRDFSSTSGRRRSYDSDGPSEMDPTKKYAQRSITTTQAMELATEVSRKASDLREALAVGNAAELDLDVDPALFA
jgi:hypothetical protein